MSKDQKNLSLELMTYAESGVYPFHMPGHKRQGVLADSSNDNRGKTSCDAVLSQISQMDITEVEGFDNLHHPEGILREAQERMAEVFGADRSYFLINGSTCGLLAAVSAAVPKGGKILIARNCHKAVYNAIYLRELSVEYVYPMQTAWGIQGSIDPEQVREKLDTDPQIQAVLITSPTYDGVVSDIAAISKIVHAHNIPLLVDEAHGAHFGFSNGFPQKALTLGADVVIESIHKTLPAFTQSAALHVKGNRVSIEKIEKFLGIYQSSSPSYLLMAGLDRCVGIMKEQGQQLMRAYEKRLARFYQQAKGLQHIKVLTLDGLKEKTSSENSTQECCMQECSKEPVYAQTGIWCKEPSKILISCEHTGMSGRQLAHILLKEFGLEMEMVSGHYVTALTSLMDTEEGFERLLFALYAIDETVCQKQEAEENRLQESMADCDLESGHIDWCQLIDILYAPKEKQMEIAAASEAETIAMPFAQAAGKVSGEFAYLYPPGIPFLTPGEVIPASVAQMTDKLIAEGFEIQGLADLEGVQIRTCVDGWK